MADHCDNIETPEDRGTLWTPPGAVDPTPEFTEAVRVAGTSMATQQPLPAIDIAIGLEVEPREDVAALEPGLQAAAVYPPTGLEPETAGWDEVGLGPRTVDSEEEHSPTIEFGGPRIQADDTIDYASLAENNYGPRPTLPPLFTEPSEFSEDDDGEPEDSEGVAVEGDDGEQRTSFPFTASGYVTLSDDDRRDLTLARIKEVETEKYKLELRLWELRTLESQGDPEFAENVNRIAVYTFLVAEYVNAFNEEFGGEQ